MAQISGEMPDLFSKVDKILKSRPFLQISGGDPNQGIISDWPYMNLKLLSADWRGGPSFIFVIKRQEALYLV